MSCDLTKAYDCLSTDLIMKSIQSRVKNDEEQHITNLIHNLHSNRKMEIGDETIRVNKGVPQGGVLSPLIFNTVLEEILMDDESLNEAIKNGKLVCFADDILLIADDKAEAEKLVRAMMNLEQVGLHLNKQKTQFITDRKDMDETEEIAEIRKVKSLKYLGLSVSCDRKQILKDAKNKCTKYLAYVRGKI